MESVSESMAAVSLNDFSSGLVATLNPGGEGNNTNGMKNKEAACAGTVAAILQASHVTASLMVTICDRLLEQASVFHNDIVMAKRLVDDAHGRMEALVAYIMKLLARYEQEAHPDEEDDYASPMIVAEGLLPHVFGMQSGVAQCKHQTDVAYKSMNQLVLKFQKLRAWYQQKAEGGGDFEAEQCSLNPNHHWPKF